MKIKFALLIVYLILFFQMPLAFSVQQRDLQPNEILVTVSDDVQLLFDKAPENSTLVFDVGTYTLNLLVNKSINLRGISTSHVILKGDGQQPIFEVIDGADVVIQNFTLADSEVGVRIVLSNVTIQNTLFLPGADNTAIEMDFDSNATIENNTFDNLRVAVEVLEQKNVIIKNNTFSNLTNIDVLFINVIYDSVSANCFDQVVPGYSTLAFSEVEADLGFVNIDNNDFHLLDSSVCKGAGKDGPGVVIDMGAYGGAQADEYAFPLSGVTVVSGVLDDSVKVSWQKNNDYRIDGYKIYYAQESLSDFGYDADRSRLKNETALVGDAELTIEGLGAESANITAPVLVSVLPVSSGKLAVTWNKVSNATSYTLYYRANNVAETGLDVGGVNAYTLTGLTDGVNYTVWLTATNQYKYYFQAVASIENNGSIIEGLFVNADTVYARADKDVISEVSASAVAMPEAVVPYPFLPDEGCFVATAAFGFYSHGRVQILRDFRDAYLQTNELGRSFVRWYYRYGPFAAALINQYEILKPVARVLLYPLILLAEAIAYHLVLFWVLFFFYLLLLVLMVKWVWRWRVKGSGAC